MAIGSVRCVVFDLDDTLWNTIDTLSAAHEAMQASLAELCPEVAATYGSSESFREEMKKTMEEHPEKKHDFTFVRLETLKRISGCGDIAHRVFEAWFARRNSPVFFPGALEALAALRAAGLRIGTLTDGNSDPTTMEGLREVIDFAVSAAEAGAAKPDRRMFQLCEAKSSCSPAELVMVGDSAEKDVAGAKAAGWRAIWVRPPSQGPAIVGSAYDLSGARAVSGEAAADAAVDHVKEVEGHLRVWAAAAQP